MIYIKSIALALLFVFLVSCPGTGPSPDVVRPLDDYDRLIREDGERTDVLEGTKKRYEGNTCEEEDDRRHECVEQCKEIYRTVGYRKDCEELPIRQIVVLHELHEILERPDIVELEDIDLEDFRVYIKVSISGFDKLIIDYGSSDAEEVLYWVATNEEVTDILERADRDNKTLERLFKEIKSFTPSSETHTPFTQRIARHGRLMEIAIDAGNHLALEWFQDYIFKTANTCSDEETHIDCFKVFCKIGKTMDDNYREGWLDFEDFERYIDNIIEDGTNGDPNPSSNQWDTDVITGINDITDFYENLCGNLADL